MRKENLQICQLSFKGRIQFQFSFILQSQRTAGSAAGAAGAAKGAFAGDGTGAGSALAEVTTMKIEMLG